MNLIYINNRDSSVMESQVLALLDFYQASGSIEHITLLQGYSGIEERQRIAHKIGVRQFSISWYRSFPNFRIFFIPSFLTLFLKIKESIAKQPNGKTVIHVRGENTGSLVSTFLRFAFKHCCKLLVDIRGAGIPEVQIYSLFNQFRKRWKINRLKNSMRILVSHESEITVVSKSLKDYLVNEFGFNPARVSVNYNIADEKFGFNEKNRYLVRRKLGIEDHEILGISLTGGAALWQKDLDIMDVLLSCGIRIINLSRVKSDREHVINMYVAFEEIPDFLSASDFAILWRDDNTVNNVASPSKFSEFCANGLPVIHNGTVKLANDYIIQNGFGLIIHDPEDLNEINFQGFKDISMRIKMSGIGLQKFGIKNIAGSYLNLYKQTLESLNCL